MDLRILRWQNVQIVAHIIDIIMFVPNVVSTGVARF